MSWDMGALEYQPKTRIGKGHIGKGNL